MKYFIIFLIYMLSLFHLLYSQIPVTNEAFLLNDDTTGTRPEHLRPSVTTLNYGKTVVVWADDRKGSHNIYMQLYSNSGLPIGSNMQVNTDSNRARHSFPEVAADGRGYFAVAWIDQRNGVYDVYFQMFDSIAKFIGENIRINSVNGTKRKFLALDCDSSGNYVVAYQPSDYEIYFQRIDHNGKLSGDNIAVSNSEGVKSNPSITLRNNGELAISWDEWTGNDYDVLLKRYSVENLPLGDIVEVSDSQRAFDTFSVLSYAKNGNLITIWEDGRDTTTYFNDIYCQVFDEMGNKIDSNFIINDDTLQAPQRTPSISCDARGIVNICWTDYRNGQEIYFQQMDENGLFIGENQKINNTNIALAAFPNVSANDSGYFSIVFEGQPPGLQYYSDIYLQRFSPSTEKLGNLVKVNDDAGAIDQEEISLSINTSGTAVASWQDTRNRKTNIFFQKFSITEGLINNNFQAPDTLEGNNASSVVITDDDQIHLVWEVYHEYVPDVFYQHYNSDNLPDRPLQNITKEITNPNQHYEPDIAVDANGNTYIVWECGQSSNKIMMQRFDPLGNKIGKAIQVNDSLWSYKYKPDIVISENGYIIVVWGQSLYVESDVYAQWFQLDGTKIGGNIRIPDAPTSGSYAYPVVAIDSIGRAAIAWKDYRTDPEHGNVYLQRLSVAGGLIGPNLKISEEVVTREEHRPAIAMNPFGHIIVVWHQFSTGTLGDGIIGQIVLPDGILWGSNFHVVAPEYKNNTTEPIVVANSSHIVYAWLDGRRSKGWDVYAKFDTWDRHNVTNITGINASVQSFILEQNYPNPFNPLTHICFYLPKMEYVKIDIFNMLGQRVKSFSRKKMAQGSHTITFDGSPFTSGIYFVKMKAGNFTDVKKMVLIK
jgi:hypothetical protein